MQLTSAFASRRVSTTPPRAARAQLNCDANYGTRKKRYMGRVKLHRFNRTPTSFVIWLASDFGDSRAMTSLLTGVCKCFGGGGWLQHCEKAGVGYSLSVCLLPRRHIFMAET